MTELYKKGESFNIPGIQANGMDVEDVYNAAMFASDHARSGKGPIIVEVKTYRFRGHSMSDPAKYRTKEEVEQYKGLDPLNEVRNIIINNKYATEDELKSIEKKIKAKISEVEEFATLEPLPSSSELFTDIYK